MATSEREDDSQLTPEERRLRLEAMRLALDYSFAKKWLPALATIMIGVIAGMFSYVQHQASIEQTKQASEETKRARIEANAVDERVRIEAKAKDQREWGFKVVDLYFSEYELFDLTRNAETAASNLSVLAAVAPTNVRGVLYTELIKIPPPSSDDDTARMNSLAAVARVQDALTAAEPSTARPKDVSKPSDFTVYVQYAAGDKDIGLKAKSALIELGYRVPGIEQVSKPPSRLQVRYYLPDQKSHAGELAEKLGKLLSLKATADNAILVTSPKQLPGGILEVWLPDQAN